MSKIPQEVEVLIASIEAALANATPGRWFAEEDRMSWDLYAQHVILDENHNIMNVMHPLKLIKAPKQSTEFAEYWPNKGDEIIIVNATAWLAELIKVIKLKYEG
jgi:hypothetical protein